MSEMEFLKYTLLTHPRADFDDMYQDYIREDLKK